MLDRQARPRRLPLPGLHELPGDEEDLRRRLHQLGLGPPVGSKSKGKVSWQLWTGRDGLLKRLITADTVGEGRDPLVKRSDTRYTGWGFRLVIAAPPADEVIDEADLLEYVRELNEPIPPDAGNT
nr:hypothetical protein GCM10020093_078460 [Planobispora longispora]